MTDQDQTATDTISMTELELAMRKLANTVKLDTIEACAKIAEHNMHASIMPGHVGKNIASEIRTLAGSAVPLPASLT